MLAPIFMGVTLMALTGSVDDLTEAASRGRLDDVKRVVASDVAVDALDGAGRTGLMAAATNGRVEVLDFLLDTARAKVGVVDKHGEDALFKAVKRGQLPAIDTLLRHKALTTRKTKNGETLLFAAVESQKIEVVERVLQLAVPLDTVDSNEQTALCVAARAGWQEGVTALFQKGASLNGALRFSVLGGQVETTEFLLKHGVAVDSVHEGCTALHTAALQANLAMVKLLLSHGASVKTECEGRSILLSASLYAKPESVEVLKALMKAGVKPTSGTVGPAVWVAADRGSTELVQLLVYYKHDAGDYRDDHDVTPLMRAALGGHEAVARVLIEYGARAFLKDEKGKTAAMYAREGNHEALAQWLEGGN